MQNIPLVVTVRHQQRQDNVSFIFKHLQFLYPHAILSKWVTKILYLDRSYAWLKDGNNIKQQKFLIFFPQLKYQPT